MQKENKMYFNTIFFLSKYNTFLKPKCGVPSQGLQQDLACSFCCTPKLQEAVHQIKKRTWIKQQDDRKTRINNLTLIRLTAQTREKAKI